MQLEIYTPVEGQTLPPIEWNYEELKAQLTDGLAAYKGRVYDENSIGEAKKDRAALNKLASLIDDRRKDMKARYLAPYEQFEKQAKELVGLVKEQSAEIDAQVKAFDEARKAEKLEHIKAKYVEIFSDLVELVPYDKIHNKKWLNVTTSMASIEDELTELASKINNGIDAINALEMADNVKMRVEGVFLNRLDLAEALAEKDRIEAEQKALEARRQAQAQAAQTVQEKLKPKPQQLNADDYEEPFPMDFRVYVTRKQLQMLKAFLVNNGIDYGRVPK